MRKTQLQLIMKAISVKMNSLYVYHIFRQQKNEITKKPESLSTIGLLLV